MPRTTRIHAPGVAFHIVAVTQGRIKWFDDAIRRRICSDIDAAAGSAGHTVLARTVMPNHLHLILKAGSLPLGWMMQRILQRASAQVRMTHDIEGHVFLRRYWAEPIPTPKYLRRAIVYTHLNPCKANLAGNPGAYEFSSHRHFVGQNDGGADFAEGVMLFANEKPSLEDARDNYLKFVEFCEERRRNGVLGDWLLPGGVLFGAVPSAQLGDDHWVKTYTHFDGDISAQNKQPDIFNLAQAILPRIDRNLDLETIRFGKKHPRIIEPRNQLVAALLSAQCKPSAIARLLCISPSVVSRVRRDMVNAASEKDSRVDLLRA